jgi:hypothetical protein
MSAFGGMLMAIIRSNESAGDAEVTISSKGLKPAVIQITSK